MKSILNTLTRLLIVFSLFAFSGCIKVSSLPQQSGYYHRVKYPGETLAIISTWYTGNVENWRKIGEVNGNRSPHRLQMGDRIFIPPALVKTRKPLPASFVKAFYEADPSVQRASGDRGKRDRFASKGRQAGDEREAMASSPDLRRALGDKKSDPDYESRREELLRQLLDTKGER